MHHLTMADKSLLIGDEIADLLVAYSAVVAEAGSGDHVTLRALGIDGGEISAHILINGGTSMIAESSTSTLPEPENEAAVRYLRDRLQFYGRLPGGPVPGAMGEAAD